MPGKKRRTRLWWTLLAIVVVAATVLGLSRVAPAGDRVTASVAIAAPLWLYLGAGLVLGLLIGLGSVLLRHRFPRRLRGRADFERIGGLTVLTAVPRAVARPRSPGAHLPVLLRAPQSPSAEAYRYLRARLQPLLLRGGPRDGAPAVLVTGPEPGEGRTSTAANLAVALARSGRTVVLVDADLRGPGQHTMFDLPVEPGLAGVLTGGTDLDDALQDTPVTRLRLLAAGLPAENATDLLQGPELAKTLRALRRECDVIVLDSPALLRYSDAIAVAALSDHVLLVAESRRGTRAGVVRALAELGEVVDGNVSGVLITGARASSRPDPYDMLAGPEQELAATPPSAPADEPAPVHPGSVYTSSSAAAEKIPEQRSGEAPLDSRN